MASAPQGAGTIPNGVARSWRRVREALATLRRHRRELIWLWVAYQSVKGTLTTAIVWIPALAYWLARADGSGPPP